MERQVERVLYYARLGHVEKDYMIAETALDDIVEEALAKNKQLLIQNNIRVDTSCLHYKVHSDKKCHAHSRFNVHSKGRYVLFAAIPDEFPFD